MATKNVQLKDLNGNLLMPKTNAAVVYNNAGEALGGVEADAQVNLIEGVKVNGNLLNIDADKTVDVCWEDYTLTRETNAEEGFAASYQLYHGTVAVGDKINIPKDLVVETGDLKICEAENVPVEGLVEGEPYIDLLLANTDNQHIYIPVGDLVDIYTPGDGLTLTNNEFAVNTEDTAIVGPIADDSKKLVQSGVIKIALDNKVDKNNAITGGKKCKITFDSKGLVTAGEDLEAEDIPALDSAKVTTMGEYQKANVFEAIEGTDTLNQAIGKLEKGLDTKQGNVTGGASTIVEDNLTAGRLLVSNELGKVAASTIPSNTLFLTYEEVL